MPHTRSGVPPDPATVLRQAQIRCDHPDAAGALQGALGAGPFALICFFASAQTDFAALAAETAKTFAPAQVIGCTTAGELGQDGYEDGQIVAIGFPQSHFAAEVLRIGPLDRLQGQDVIDAVIQKRLQLSARAAQMPSEFAFLMVDGLSRREEALTGMLASGLGPMPLFGGSAGDGTSFHATYLAQGGTVFQNVALLALIRSVCPVRVFSLDHLVPTETRMVVTGADPENRLVREINAEPAAQEYARLLGKDPHQLSPFIFAAHPVVVKLGDRHHVRAIQQVNPAGELVFFSAIDEGMVLTLADHQDIAAHLEHGLAGLSRPTAPQHILGCDCILRRIEAGQVQKTRQISDILARHNVVGFSTYGEQIGGLHVNQTLTGVAIYAPGSGG